MTPDSLKVCFVAGNQRRADTARSQGNQHIEGQFPKLVYLVVLTSPHGIQQLAGVDPMRFSGRDNLAPIHQIHHEPTFKPRPRATKQLMYHYSRAANHIGSLEKTKSEATSSEIVDIDRGVQNGKPSCLQRRLASRHHYIAESPHHALLFPSPNPGPFESFRWWSLRQAPSWLVSACRGPIWRTLEQEPCSTSCPTAYRFLYDRVKPHLGLAEGEILRNAE